MATRPESAQQKWWAQRLKYRPQPGGARLGFRRSKPFDWQRWSTTFHRNSWRAAFYWNCCRTTFDRQHRSTTLHRNCASQPTDNFSQREPLKRIPQRLTNPESFLFGKCFQRRGQRC